MDGQRVDPENVRSVIAEAMIALLPTDKGGRSSPIQLDLKPPNGYRAHAKVQDGRRFELEFLYGTDASGEIDVNSLAPGESARVGIGFSCDPETAVKAFDLNATFDVLEDDKVIGTARIVGHYGYLKNK
jgi:hypothetical protein